MSRELTVLYGSQTGTVPERLGREGERLLLARVAAMDTFHIPSLPNTRLVV